MMTIRQLTVRGFVALYSLLLLGYPMTPAMAETTIDKDSISISDRLMSANRSVGNCQRIDHDTIILSGSTAIFAQPQETIQFSPDTVARPILLTLAAPLLLTDNCVLGQSVDAPTMIEATLETTHNVEGLIIKTRSIIVSGHYLPLSAESNVIPFERHVDQSHGQQGNNALCGVLGILPNVFIDSYEMGVGISSQELSLMTGGVCEMLFSQPSYFLQAELKAETFYNLRLSGIQSIPVPAALKGFMARE